MIKEIIYHCENHPERWIIASKQFYEEHKPLKCAICEGNYIEKKL